MSLWKTVLFFLTFVCMLEESGSAGKSSSIVETSSWPHTSFLLRPNLTSFSMSDVKTADLGISSTEYRETTSPATVYHSPSNWLVTTLSSTAQSVTVKPMLAPSNTTDKDKTLLYPLNTMPIKKSASTDMILEWETVYTNLNTTSPFVQSISTAFEKSQSLGVTGMKTNLPVSTVVSSTSISPSTRWKPLIKTTLSISTSRSQVSSSISSTPSKSSPSFPTSSPSVPSFSLLSFPTSALLSQRGTTVTTLLTKSTHSSMTPVRISSNAEQAAMTNSTVVTPNSRTERPTSSDSEMTSRSQVSSSISSTSLKSSPSFPTSSLFVPSTSLLSLPTSSLLSHRETTETTLLTKSTHPSMTPVRISSNVEQAAMTNSTVVTPDSRTERPTSSDSEMTSRSRVSSSISSTSLKSSPSFPTSSLSVPSSSLLSLPTSSLLSHRETTETTLLTKSTHSSMTPVRISSNAEQAAMTNSTVVTPDSRTERPTSSDLTMTSSLTDENPIASTLTKNAEAQSGGKGFIIVVVLPFFVLFLLFILTFAVLIYYVCKRKKGKYEIQEKTHPSQVIHDSENKPNQLTQLLMKPLQTPCE